MELITWLCAALLAANIALVLVLLRRHSKPAPSGKYDLSAQDLLHDLTRRGQAIIRIEVVDAANLFLRSPRG